MPQMYVGPVMDVLPWPNGHRFAGTGDWWDYVLSKDEQQRLNHLMGLALLDESICEKLLAGRDDSLLNAFDLSAETQAWLRAIQAESLVELAQAILSGPQSTLSGRMAMPEPPDHGAYVGELSFGDSDPPWPWHSPGPDGVE
jgi:hypothetical protein